MWHPVKEVAPFEILASWFDSSPIVARILGVSDMNGLKECFPVTLDSRRSLGGFGGTVGRAFKRGAFAEQA